MIIDSLNSKNQTTEIIKTKQISSKDDTSFSFLINEKEPISVKDRKEALNNTINNIFGKSSFSKALYEELEKKITSSTSKEEFMSIISVPFTIDVVINDLGTKAYEASKKGEKLDLKEKKHADNTNFISEIKDFLSLIDKEIFSDDDIDTRKSYKDLLTKVLDKTIQYENEKNSILNKNSNTPNPFQIKEIA